MADHQEKPLNELLSRDMVDIYVGQENTHWILHEKLLCYRSKFFNNIFHNKENKDHSVELPDDEDEPFRMFVGWLYSAHVPSPKEEKDLTALFDLYLMGEKWEIKDLIHEVLKGVRNFYRDNDTYPALRRVQYIYANTDLESPMRQLLISSVARNLVTSDGMPQVWDKALRKNGQLAVDIIIAMQKWNLEKSSVPDARQDSVQPIMDDTEQAKSDKKDSQPQAKPEKKDSQPQTNGVQNGDEESAEEGAEQGEDQEEGEVEEEADEADEQEEQDEEKKE